MPHRLDSGATAAHQWVLRRIDKQFRETMNSLLSTMMADLSLASSSAVTVRALSDDGMWLFPVAAYHPDPVINAAMTGVMDNTAQRTASGLWSRVCEERRAVRWQVPRGEAPAEASLEQVAFLRRFPVRAILGAPLISHDRLVGGASLVRYVVDREFTDDDEAMVHDFGVRAALALDCLRELGGVGQGDQPGVIRK